MRRIWWCLAALTLCVAPLRSSAGYLVTSLGFTANDLNNSGQVAGSKNLFGRVYSNGVVTKLGTLGGPGSDATGLNDAGQVVGWSFTSARGNADLFAYSGGALQDLGPSLEGGFKINDAGEIAGSRVSDGIGNTHAFLYSKGKALDLGILPGYTSTLATGMNNKGQVVGYAFNPSTVGTRAFLYSDGKMTFLGNLGAGSVATGVNDRGQVVGYTSTGSFMYSGGVTQPLGPPGFFAMGINAGGQVVGNIYALGRGVHAALYTNGQLIDLNAFLPLAPGSVNTQAVGINDRGQIIVNNWDAGYLLTPDTSAAPEPGTFCLLALGAVGLLGCGWRRRGCAAC